MMRCPSLGHDCTARPDEECDLVWRDKKNEMAHPSSPAETRSEIKEEKEGWKERNDRVRDLPRKEVPASEVESHLYSPSQP